MSNRLDKNLSKADQGIDNAVDKAFSASRQANTKASKLINDPEERKRAWGSAKESPLAYSFILFQLVVSFIPISISAGFVTFGAVGTFIATSIAFAIALSIGLAILVPVLFVTVPTAAFLWAAVVGTLALADWLYRNFYVDSAIQARISGLTEEVGQTYSEIEENAIREYEAYKGRAIEEGRNVKQKAIESGDRLANEVNSYAEAGRNKAVELQKNGEQFANDVKYNANGVRQKGGELVDQTKDSSKGVAHAAKNDFK